MALKSDFLLSVWSDGQLTMNICYLRKANVCVSMWWTAIMTNMSKRDAHEHSCRLHVCILI